MNEAEINEYMEIAPDHSRIISGIDDVPLGMNIMPEIYPEFMLSSLEGVQSGIPTRTTPTLTPTTLRNIVQIFESQPGEPPEIHTNQAGFVPPLILTSTTNTFVDNKTWGGGIVTLNPVKHQSGYQDLGLDLEMPSISHVNSPPEKRRSGGRPPSTMEDLSVEERESRQLRRERNKEAAAKCRKRRMDQTSRLQDETDDLLDKKSGLQSEIEMLQRQKNELEFLLDSHQPSCRKDNKNHVSRNNTGNVRIKAEPHEMELDTREVEQILNSPKNDPVTHVLLL